MRARTAEQVFHRRLGAPVEKRLVARQPRCREIHERRRVRHRARALDIHRALQAGVPAGRGVVTHQIDDIERLLRERGRHRFAVVTQAIQLAVGRAHHLIPRQRRDPHPPTGVQFLTAGQTRTGAAEEGSRLARLVDEGETISGVGARGPLLLQRGRIGEHTGGHSVARFHQRERMRRLRRGDHLRRVGQALELIQRRQLNRRDPVARHRTPRAEGEGVTARGRGFHAHFHARRETARRQPPDHARLQTVGASVNQLRRILAERARGNRMKASDRTRHERIARVGGSPEPAPLEQPLRLRLGLPTREIRIE